MATLRVTVWNEGVHEQKHEAVQKVYPQGIHGAIAEGLREAGFSVQTATLDQPEHGLSETVLDQTDVLIWWAHVAHNQVDDAIVERVHQRVLGGMGLIVLHSGHLSKIFRRVMGTSCNLAWRENSERERIWVVNPAHPIADGLGDYFVLEEEETYGEPFGIPEPDSLVFVSWFSGGEIFRSGGCWYRDQGKVFYFRPGHETFPTYYDPNVRKVIANAVRWAMPTQGAKIRDFNRREPLEKL